MIQKINLVNCVPYKQAELSDCKKVNFIFGANGSGKSTISSLLSGVNDSRFDSSYITWDKEVYETIYVYNREFRRRNFQQNIPGVFTLGSATIDEIKELELIKKKLDNEQKDLDKIDINYSNTINKEIPEIENKFKDDAWKLILKENEKDFSKAFEGLRGSKEKFLEALKNRIEGIPGHIGSVCDIEELKTRAETLYAEKPSRWRL